MDNKDTYFSQKRTLNCNGRLVDLSSPIIMGIVNVTSDSFYPQSRCQSEQEVAQMAQRIVSDGATIIDVGACSTRPGSTLVSEQEEKTKLDMALRIIRKLFPQVILSVDTFRASIAKWSFYEWGVNIINDISAGSLDSEMFSTICELKIPYIVMHMKGEPTTMQLNPTYENIIEEIITTLQTKIQQLKNLGLTDIIVDPGFGFGKSIEDNYTLLNHLSSFKIFEYPLLVGLSRKSMIYRTLNITPEQALNGTTVLHTIALIKGASILRVHDVKAAAEAIKLIQKMAEKQ